MALPYTTEEALTREPKDLTVAFSMNQDETYTLQCLGNGEFHLLDKFGTDPPAVTDAALTYQTGDKLFYKAAANTRLWGWATAAQTNTKVVAVLG